MAKRKKVEVKMYSYGEYERWDRESKEIPKLVDITNTIKASIGTEFGYVLFIKKAKGVELKFRIDHPNFVDSNGEPAPSFTGDLFIGSNDYEFFLGDCIWEPLKDKLGDWTMTTWVDGKEVAKKTLHLI